MKYYYKDDYDSEFSLVDASEIRFSSKDINEICYKIIWSKDDDISLGADGCRIYLKKR